MSDLDKFPGIQTYLNPEAIANDLEERSIGGTEFVRVTQTFDEGEGEQFLFSFADGVLALVGADNVVEFPSMTLQAERFAGYDGTMSDDEHAEVARQAIQSVDVFKTGGGPGHGSVACLWAARRVVHAAVGQWITQVDGTTRFHEELTAGGMIPVAADTLPPGAIIISPTDGKRIGHIGLLGTGSGRSRLVYSNHSPSARKPVACWMQNYTVGLFIDYHDRKNLPTLFYRLPRPAGAPATS